MTTALTETSPATRGRVLGVLYLIVVLGGIAGQAMIADRLIIGDDPGRTAERIVANRSLYRLAFTIFLVEMAAQMATIMLFYDLLKPVNRSVARLATIMGLTASGIKTMARAFFYAPLLLLGGAPWLAAFTTAQLETLSLIFIRINGQAAAIALVFFGFEAILQGWLMMRSGFLPRFLGVISIMGGVGWLTYLWPPLGSRMFLPVAGFAVLGVLTTAGWLLVRGVDDAQWRTRAALATASIWR
jgi:hypothetical protein